MSDFGETILDFLPIRSELHNSDNPLRKVIDRTVGEWVDNSQYTGLEFKNQMFLNTATGQWLDLFGHDYGVYRQPDESDDDFRQRIIYEKLDELTPALLQDVYNVKLFTYYIYFNAKDNTLVSDNPYIVQNNSFIGLSDIDTIRLLDKKFIMDNVITWINDEGDLDYIFDSRGINVLSDYSEMYTLNHIPSKYFWNTRTIVNVKLKLPIAIECGPMFYNCFDLTTVNLNLPNTTNCQGLFYNCSGLKDVKLNIPKLSLYNLMFTNATAIETIDVTIPPGKVDGFKTYVLGLDLAHLTSFIINGEEVEL